MQTRIMFFSVICSLWLVFSVISWLPAYAEISVGPVVQEVVASRNDHTRVWEYTRQVPVTDDETGVTELVTVRNEVYEKGDNLCYNRSTAKTPEWVPTVEEISLATETGFAYQAKQGGYQVSFTGDLSRTAGSILYQVGNQQLRSGVRYLGYYDTSNGNSVFLSSVASVVPRLISPNKLYYSNAFPGVDIEYVYTKGKFQQNAIINSLEYYQPPSRYGMNPNSTYLVVFTELDLATTQNKLQVSVNEQKYTGSMLTVPQGYPIAISNSVTGKPFCSFEPNQAFDNSTEQRNEVAVHQHVVSQEDRNYFVEGIPYSWLTAAVFPVTIDYEQRTGGIDVNETWVSGKTYYVSGTVTVTSGGILAIQGGAIVKIALNAQIAVASDGKIIARGSKFNYVIFTNEGDNSVGETTGHSGGIYSCAINLNSGSSPNSMIRYCKINHANTGIEIAANLDSNNPIQNNIIRDCNLRSGITVLSGGNALIKNNIIVGGGYGGSGIQVSGTATIEFNTIDDMIKSGVKVNTGAIANIFDNLISNTDGYSLYSSANCTLNHDTNAFYEARLPANIARASGEIILTANPYVSSPNGSYYLNQACPCVDVGPMSANDANMQGKTTSCPTTFFSENTINSYTWHKVGRDIGQVDIGYHYDPVDVVVGTNANNYQVEVEENLSIDSGVAVSFYRDASDISARVRIKNNAKVTAVGCDVVGSSTSFIQFTSIYATSDQIQAPLRGGLDVQDYLTGLILRFGSNPDSDIEYCEFQYGQYGLRVFDPMNLNRPIQNNVFQNNLYGLGFHYTANAVNNLFTDNQYGLHINSLGTTAKLINYIQSNTFYNNGTALWVVSTTSAETTLVRFENNLITSNYGGCIGTSGNNGTIQSETRNNLYWNNETNVDGTRITLNNSNTDNKDNVNGYCPMLVHQARLSDNEWVGLHPPNAYLHDGFYLAQRAGDASRFPLRQHDLTGIDIGGISTQPAGNAIVRVYAATSLTDTTLLGEYGSISGYSDRADCWGNILLELVDDADYWTLTSGDYIELTFANSSKVKVYLPGLGRIMGSLYLWVAQDGSTYYGTRNYFAQHNDLTWFPLREHDLDDIGCSRELNEQESIAVLACTSYGQAVGLGYYCYDEESKSAYYADGEDCWGNIAISINGNFYFGSGDYLDLYFADGTTVHIDVSGMGVPGYNSFFVAEDGSYHFVPNWNWSLDQDAYFAMQYDMPNVTGYSYSGLAMSAYDGASTRFQAQDSARSPAIDKGAVKVTPSGIAGTTNDVKYTLFASLGWTNSDDTSLSTRDSQTTARYISASISSTHTDPINRLDLGYHYKSGVVYTQDIFDRFTTYWENATTTFLYGNIPTIGGNHALGAGNWNSDQLTQNAIAVFRTEDSSSYIEALGYHILNTPVVRLVSTYSIHTPGFVEQVPVVGIQGLSVAAAPNGTVYTAIGFNCRIPPQAVGGAYYTNTIQVYQYDDSSSKWYRIGQYYSDASGNCNIVHDVAVAASNDTVWVTWTSTSSGTAWIWGKVISANGYTSISPYNILQLNISWNPLEITKMLNLTYDARATTARIVFVDDKLPSQNPDGNPEIRAGQLDVGLNLTPSPNGAVVSDTTWTDVQSPRIAFNPYYAYSGVSSAYISFYRVYGGETTGDKIKAADLVNPAPETWLTDTKFTNITGDSPDVTYRANGEKLVTWESGSDVLSNCGVVVQGNSTSNPRVATNGQNQRDIVINWSYEYNGTFLCGKELLP